ncbi:MAG: hypothetical protein OXB88_03625 [Bacteriovoracales bacterium]|nr:hypothetical protein [Bacteriovoracales bacterium]
MSQIIVIAHCTSSSLKASPPDSGKGWASFHFIGAWNGHWIEKICLEFRAPPLLQAQEGEEYIILMRATKIVGKALFGRIEKITPLSSLESFF